MHCLQTIFGFYGIIRSLSATYIMQRGHYYIIGFFPISINDTHVDEKALQSALTVESKLRREYRGYWGFIIFDTKKNHEDIIKSLVELKLKPELRKMLTKSKSKHSSCCVESGAFVNVVAVIGMMSLEIALQVKLYLTSSSIRYFIGDEYGKTQDDTYKLLYYNSHNNMYRLHEMDSVDVLQFFIRYKNWKKVVIITSDQYEMNRLWLRLNTTDAYYAYAFLATERIHHTKILFDKIKVFVSNTASIDAIILWNYFRPVITYLFKKLDTRLPIVTGMWNYNQLGPEIRTKFNIYPMQSIKDAEYSFVAQIRNTAIQNKWVKKLDPMGKQNIIDNLKTDVVYSRAISIVQLSNVDRFMFTPDYIFDEFIKNGSDMTVLSSRYSILKCKPGFYQIWIQQYSANSTFTHIRKSRCAKCPQNYIKAEAGSQLCKPCPSDFRSNGERTKCKDHEKIFVTTSSRTAKVMYILITIGCCLVLCMALIFVINRKTPVVKSSIQNLLFIQLFGHFMLMLVLISLIGEPTYAKCQFSIYSIGLLYTLIMACIFTKAYKLLTVFQSIGRMSNKEVIITKLLQYVIVFILVMAQTCLTFVNFILSPPHVSRFKDERHFTEYLTCPKEPFLYQFLYTLLLSLICLVQAFRARKLPMHYNETKYIVFAMISNILIIIIFLVSLTIVDGIDIVFAVFQAVFASNMISVLILNGYKVWIIIFRPMKNRTSVFRHATFDTMRKVSGLKE